MLKGFAEVCASGYAGWDRIRDLGYWRQAQEVTSVFRGALRWHFIAMIIKTKNVPYSFSCTIAAIPLLLVLLLTPAESVGNGDSEKCKFCYILWLVCEYMCPNVKEPASIGS